MNRHRRLAIGYFCGILAAITYGMNPLFGLHLYRDGIGTPSVLFYRFCFATILLGILIILRRNSFRIPLRTLPLLVAGGLLLAASCLTWFLSFRVMDSGLAATILFLYPIMVAAIMAAVFHERITWPVAAAILLALAGTAILCQPGGAARVNARGVLFVILSALTYAVYIVGVQESRLRELSPDVLTFYALLFGTPVFLLQLRGGIDLQWLPTWSAFGNALGLAVFPSFLSFLLMAVAIPRIGATRTAILGALEPVTAVAIGILVFHEPMTARLALGIAMVIGSVLAVVACRQK